MTPLHIQNFMRSAWEDPANDLLTKYAIKAKRHSRHPNLVLFKYDQIASPFAEPIVRECRGIILDENDNWNVIARAFDKFFNYGEGHAADIHWPTARVQEKIDGSLCALYHYSGEWHVATTGTPDASGDTNGSGITFADLFWQTLGDNRPTVVDQSTELTFLFELTSPLNRIVVVHDKPKLTLLGARHARSGLEVCPVIARGFFHHHVPVVREFPLQSIADITASFESMSPLAQEGYVVVDDNFNRIKVKHPGYVALHHAKDGMSTKAFVQIARSGETSEVIAAFPEFKPLLDEAKSRFEELVRVLETCYARIQHIVAQKDFAAAALQSPCSAALFAVRSKKAESIRAFLSDYRLESLVQLLGY